MQRAASMLGSGRGGSAEKPSCTPASTRPKLVLAGSEKIYDYWITTTRKNRKDYRYVHDSQSLLGYRDVEVIRLKGWQEKPGIYEAIQRFRALGTKIIDV